MYIDLETGGLNHKKHPILQIAGIIEIDGRVKELFNIKVLPEDFSKVDQDALDAIGLTKEDLAKENGYVSEDEAFELFFDIIVRYLDTDKFTDKFHIVGYNIGSFDVPFLRTFFAKYDLNYGYYFWYPPIDVCYLMGYASMKDRAKLPNYKLMTVAKSLGVKVEIEKAHDALYDVEVTKMIFDLFRQEYD